MSREKIIPHGEKICQSCGGCRMIYEIVSSVYGPSGNLIVDGIYTECKACKP